MDPMTELTHLYEQYANAVELAKPVPPVQAAYWAPAPPPLTLAATR